MKWHFRVICLLVVVIGSYVTVITYKNLALWLFLEDPLPENADYICTFAGSSEREPYALELMKKYKNAVWIANTERKDFKHWVYQNGLDSNRIVITFQSYSTFEEIWQFRTIINNLKKKEQSYNSHTPLICFVSSSSHMRRISILFSCAKSRWFKNGLFLPAFPDNSLSAKTRLLSWWKVKELKAAVDLEVKKIVINVLIFGPVLILTALFG